MGITNVASKAVRKVGTSARKHPKTSIAVGAYSLGASRWKPPLHRQNPQFYDATPNNGRSEDKHPNAGSYYD